MAVETELKLRIAPGQLARLKRHVLLKSCSISRPVTRRIYNIYYDTPELDLHASGMALRLRRVGRQWLQTLKGGGFVQSGLHQRHELEMPVSSAKLDFSFLTAVSGQEVAEWDKQLRPSLRMKLRPVFVTDFSRTSRMLDFQGAKIELCMDQGVVNTERRSTSVCELELELKSGDPQQLFKLAQAILEIVPFDLEITSKAEQGYRLLTGYSEHPVKAAATMPVRTDTLADALKALIWSCLQHFQNNLHGAMESDDAEYLHQLRVALRRLREVLRMTEKIRVDAQLAGLRKEVSALCVALGRVREWDVFIAQTVRPMCKRMSGHVGLQALQTASERQQAACYMALRDAAQAHELQRLLLRFAVWMNSDYWQQTGWQQAEMQGVQDFAGRRLNQLAERFVRSGQQLDSLDAARLHALRIDAKKLRYSAEFFATLYDKRKTKSFLAALSEVQEVLGLINDVAVAHRLLDGLAVDAATRQEAIFLEAVTLTRGWIAHDLARQFGVLRKTFQRFNKQAAFWGK